MKPVLFPILTLFLLISILNPPETHAQCVPASAQMLVSGDDTTSVWINGAQVAASVAYCGGTCVPVPIPVPPAVFNQGQSILVAVETDNINPNQIFSAWELEINCSSGFKWVISSQTYASIQLYYDPNGAGAGVTGCSGAGAAPPATAGGGNPCTSDLYNPVSNPFTLTGAPSIGTTYASLIFH